MLAVMIIAAAAAGSHSADAAAAVSRIGESLRAPVLVALEGDPGSPAWQRVVGWLEVPIEQVAYPMSTDPGAGVRAELTRLGLPCAVHLRQTSDGWEGALIGQCGQLSLPGEMAMTATALAAAPSRTAGSAMLRHGFRVGYAYTRDASFATPHLLVMGYEVRSEIVGGEGLDVLMLGNFSLSGLNQSVARPTINLLLGAELADTLQVGVGPSLSWLAPEEEALHMILAAGWTGTAGDLQVPLHLAWIPDVRDNDQVIVTTGVTF